MNYLLYSNRLGINSIHSILYGKGLQQKSGKAKKNNGCYNSYIDQIAVGKVIKKPLQWALLVSCDLHIPKIN